MENAIPKTMKCIVTTGDGKFALKRAPVPTPSPNEILVKVEACALNHTDCSFLMSRLVSLILTFKLREIRHLTPESWQYHGHGFCRSHHRNRVGCRFFNKIYRRKDSRWCPRK